MKNGKRHNPEKRSFRGISYKKGFRGVVRIKDLRDAASLCDVDDVDADDVCFDNLCVAIVAMAQDTASRAFRAACEPITSID